MTAKLVTACTIMAATSWANVVHADTYPRQAGVDVQHYTFRLVLRDTSDDITGDATVRVRFPADNVDALSLDLVSSNAGKGMHVTRVSSEDRSLVFTHRDNRLRIQLAAPSTAGQVASFTVSYSGVPIDGLRFAPNVYGERTIFSENWPDRARHWLPMIDHPYDKATGEFLVTAPAHYQVIANGALVEETDIGNGTRLTHWKQAVPIASWLYAIGVARFSVRHTQSLNGLPLQMWTFPQDREKGQARFDEASRTAMDFFSDNVGPFSYEKLAHVQATGISGATEHATAIFYNEHLVSSNDLPAWIVAHEVAHHWFGNAVTERDWDDVWLSEGFATYFALLHTEHVEGRDAFVDGLTRSRDTAREFSAKLEDSAVVHRNLSDMRHVSNPLTYEKGGWVLHMLRRAIGTDAFWRGIREYYRRYRNNNASTDDFRTVMEEAAGANLTRFFRQWLNRPGLPRLEGTWRYDAGRRHVDVSLVQAQPAEPFRLSLEIGVRLPSETPMRVERVEFADRRATFSLPADVEPQSVVLDPDTWLLFEGGTLTKAP